MFGNTLTAICQQEKCFVPKFIIVITEVIEEKGLDTDGLYRVSGNLSAIQRIRYAVDQGLFLFVVVGIAFLALERETWWIKVCSLCNSLLFIWFRICLSFLWSVCSVVSQQNNMVAGEGYAMMYASLNKLCFIDKYLSVVNEDDVHVLTGALKLFFRELAEPIFPYSIAKEFITANSKHSMLFDLLMFFFLFKCFGLSMQPIEEHR